MTRIECSCCGSVLSLPDSVPEGGELACARCHLVMLNVEATRRFRWAEVDPYVRRHGASRLNLWGGLGGASLWLPVLAVALAVNGRFDAPFVASLALPYLALLAVLARKRARTPAMVWIFSLWMGLGCYGLYVAALVALRPDWAALLSGASGASLPGVWWGFSGTALATGALGVALSLRKARRVPRIAGAPPEA